MKTSDYISIFTIAIAGTILAYFLMNYFLGDPVEKTVSFEYLEAVSGDLVTPDSEVFNAGAINPTVEVFVGSCEDINHDGVIDEGEKVECGEARGVDTGETTSEDEESVADMEEETMNGGTNTNGGTNESTNNGTNSGSSNTNGSAEITPEQQADQAARRETVSE